MPDLTEYRQHLLAHLVLLDQLQAEFEQMLAAPGDAEIGVRAEELREMIVDLQALVEGKLDQISAS